MSFAEHSHLALLDRPSKDDARRHPAPRRVPGQHSWRLMREYTEGATLRSRYWCRWCDAISDTAAAMAAASDTPEIRNGVLFAARTPRPRCLEVQS